MWSNNSKQLAARFADPASVPTDAEYVEYLMREMAALGFTVRKLSMSGGGCAAVAIDLLDGDARAVLFCKAVRRELDAQSAQRAMALKSMYKAARYVIVCDRRVSDDVSSMAARNGFGVVGGFPVGGEILELLSEAGIIPSVMASMLTKYRRDAEERARRALAEKKRREAEAEAIRLRQVTEEQAKGMTPEEKYAAGLYDERVPDAIAAVSTMDVVSTGGLSRKIRVDMDVARSLLADLEELGVVGALSDGRPREVVMTAGMIEKKFGIRVKTGLR